MIEREKVIKGLICHVHGDPHTRCHKCPYWGTGPHGLSQCSQLFADALAILNALLKAQEPRMMTLEEVKALQPDTDIWIEVRYLNAPIRIRACTVSGFSPGGTRLFIIGGAHNYPMDMYNNYFRCWTSRPTDAQREATPWES